MLFLENVAHVDDLPFLAVGTEVSARYKGAFCEAKIKKISKAVKCKVQYPSGSVSLVLDDNIKGPIKVGASVEVKCSDKKELIKATIQKIHDYSQYTVVFDDGDVTCLKRTSLCLKSGKHFASSATLDQLPLTHPEHNNSTAVYSSGQRSRTQTKSVRDNTPEPIKMNDIGKVVCVMSNDKKIRHNWFPGLIVTPKSQSSIKTNITDDYLVRSFKDGKYYAIPKKEITEFTKEVASKVENPTLKTAVEKALLYLDKDELPPHWDRDLLFGLDKNCVTTDSENVSDSGNSEDESFEEKDHFVARLFKFMDDRGTPLNQLPVINDKDVDLYKLFKVVNSFGGFNKVDKCKHWKIVAEKIGHEQSYVIVKQSYLQYLLSFEDFHRKLGCTMINNPRNVRSRNRFSRSIIRDVDKSLPNASLTSADKNKSSTSSKLDSNDKKDKPETIVKENEVQKDSVVIKKGTKTSKTEEKLSNKNIDEPIKKVDKKKTDTVNTIDTNNSLRNRPSAKSDSKIKKELKETLKVDEDIKEQLCDAESSVNKKIEKKKSGRNLFGKSVAKFNKTDQIDKVKSAETGLQNARKKRSIKEQIKTFVKVITPFKKTKKGAPKIQSDTLNKIKSDEDLPKLTRSKSKDDFLNKSRKMSVISEPTDNLQVAQTSPSSSISESQCKVKKLDDSTEKKKVTIKKKIDDFDHNMTESANIIAVLKSENTICDYIPPYAAGDNLKVFYGEKDAKITVYDAKVLDTCEVRGERKFYVHYKGWNSRYDEWIGFARIAGKCVAGKSDSDLSKSDDSSKNGDFLKNADFSKNRNLSKSESKNNDSKKLPLTNSRTRRSVTPNVPNPQRKRSPLSNTRPTRTCTLSDRSLSSVGKYTTTDNSDSESEYSGNLGLTKKYNKKSQQILKTAKSNNGVTKTELSNTEGQKKTYPKTYPSKELLMQKTKKPKSSHVLHNNVTEETGICGQIIHKAPFKLNHKMPPPSDSKILDSDKKNVKKYNYTHQSKFSLDDNNSMSDNDLKVSIDFLSLKQQAEKDDEIQSTMSECLKTFDDKFEKNLGSSIFTMKSINAYSNLNSLLSEDKEKLDLVPNEELNSLHKIPEVSKISGIDFDLNKIRSEMKGFTPTSTSNTIDSIHSPNLPLLDQQSKSKNLKTIEPDSVKVDVYEFKESEPCDFETIPSVIDDKHRRALKNIGHPISYNLSESSELLNVNRNESLESKQNNSVSQEITEEHKCSTLFEYNPSNVIDNCVPIREDTKKFIFKNESVNITSQSDESNKSNCLSDISFTEAKQDFQNEICNNKVNDSKDQVLNLCIKPSETLSNNMFNMSETNDSNVAEFDDEDDDETKLVIADFQVDSESILVDKKYNTSNEPTENLLIESYPPRTPQLPSIDLECRSSDELKQDTSSKECTDDESTISCNESIQNDSNFQLYTHFENESTKQKSYQPSDDNENSSQSGFEFESNLKSPINKNSELESSEITINDKCNKLDNNSKNLKNKSEKGDNTVLPELQCREEIVDEDTLGAGYEMYKSCTNKDNLYEMTISSSSKNSFFETEKTSLVKNDNFETNSSHNVKNSVIENNIKISTFCDNASSTIKNSCFENSVVNVTPETDLNNGLFCEETIPGSPNGVSEEQLDQEEQKKTPNTQYAESEAISSTMFAINQSFGKSVLTEADATNNTIEEHTIPSTSSPLQKDDEILEQRHLRFLADISSRNFDVNVNKSAPPKLDLESNTEQPISQPDNSQPSKRKISSHESSKRAKTNLISVQTTKGDVTEQSEDVMPLIDGKPLVVFSPDMDSQQRQAVIIAKMNDLRRDYMAVKARSTVLDRRRKKIRKRKRELAKLGITNQNKQSV